MNTQNILILGHQGSGSTSPDTWIPTTNLHWWLWYFSVVCISFYYFNCKCFFIAKKINNHKTKIQLFITSMPGVIKHMSKLERKVKFVVITATLGAVATTTTTATTTREMPTCPRTQWQKKLITKIMFCVSSFYWWDRRYQTILKISMNET